MFAAVLAAGLSAAQPPAAPPAPLPDRWLLQLVPADLPRAAPPRLFAETWYDARHTRDIERSWERWVQFRPADLGAPATASITKLGREGVFANKRDEPVHRVVPLAVHGPLVEFDGKLYTAALGRQKGAKGEVDALHLGAAVALPGNVWYQAGTAASFDQKTVTVEEWRLEFKDDPRTADAGAVRVRGRVRKLAERPGEATDVEVRFRLYPPREPTPYRTIELVAPGADGKRVRLPTLVLGGDRDRPDSIWETNPDARLDRMTLTVATRQPPVRLEPGVPGLVQPPKAP